MKQYRIPAMLLAITAAALVLAACGSSSTSTSASSSAGSTSRTALAARRAKLETCLKQHGVTLPARPAGAGGGTGPPPGGGAYGGGGGFFGGGGGTGGGPGAGGGAGAGGGRFANPKFRAAIQACGGFRGGAGAGRFNPAARKAVIDKFVTCVSQHGYKLPTPNLTGKGPVFPASIEHNTKFEAAAKACESLLRPSGGAGSGASGSSGGSGSRV